MGEQAAETTTSLVKAGKKSRLLQCQIGVELTLQMWLER